MVAKRLGEYIEYKGISFYAFENSIEASRGAISKAVKDNKNIGSNILAAILSKYQELNPDWLFRGEGEMIRGKEEEFPSSNYKEKYLHQLEKNQHLYENVLRLKDELYKTRIAG